MGFGKVKILSTELDKKSKEKNEKKNISGSKSELNECNERLKLL
jgi:hypothetical protein